MKINLWFIWLLIKTKPLRFILLWLFMLWVFTYLTSLDLFGAIWSNPALNFGDRISFMLDSFTGIITNVTNPRVLSLLIFSFITAANLTIMLQTISRKRRSKGAKASAFGSVGAVVGSHCIACGGSFLAPLITTLAGSGAYFSGARVNTAIAISVGINFLAIVFVGYATLKLANQEKNFLLQA
jgi:hypothetical protein